MPFVDGILSTRMIRFLEKEYKTRQLAASTSLTPPLAVKPTRVPIIAVSSNLDEDSRVDYIQHGFDGWILKPLDFRRLDLLVQGVKDLALRRESLYVPGQSDWKKGGWFLP
jgi:CheY-like chemotaxis protein